MARHAVELQPSTVVDTPPVCSGRLPALDGLRGLAVLLMVLDHLLIVGGFADSPVRYTVTRLAMPAFMVVAGALVGRLRADRLLTVAAVGVVLPIAVPWIDVPNILVLYAAGAALLGLARRWGRTGVLVALVALLTASANGAWVLGGYDGFAVAGLVLAGHLIGRRRLAVVAARLAVRPLTAAGRYPLTVYVTHLLVLEAARLIGA